MSDGPVTREQLVAWIAYLRDIGVEELSTPPKRPAAARAPLTAGPDPTPTAGGDGDPTAGLARATTLDEIRAVLGECVRCRLHVGRDKLVFGVGDPNARLMFVGEGPGAEEDRKGEPFVGRAGQKLDEMIEKGVGLRRAEVYIANVVKCRPPENRTPQPDEVGTCSPFLIAQIEAIRPEVLVTLGSPATRLLLDTREGITRIRGTWREFRGIPVMPTFHPAYLLRQYTYENRKKVYADMVAVRERLGLGS